jgi:hypothetical protein
MNTPRDLAIPLTRVTWRDGQTLTARDLRDDQNYGDRLRHLHIRYLHKTWGVVEGLNVIAAGTAAVAVSSGYALDIAGRELLLPTVTRVAAPANIAASTTMYLVVSRNAPSAGCGAAPDLAALRPGVRDPVPLEAGALSWKTVTEVRLGEDVLLARVLIASGNLASAVDTSVQRRAATLKQPRIWSDETTQGQTGWTDSMANRWPEMQATVDTSAAGFVIAPAYFARLAGTSQAAPGFIRSAGPSSFTFVVRVDQALTPGTADNAARAEGSGWTIVWLAVELPSQPPQSLS